MALFSWRYWLCFVPLLLVMASCGLFQEKNVSADRPAHHTESGFKNPPGSPERTSSPTRFMGFLWRRLWDREDFTIPADHVMPAAAQEAQMASIDRPSTTWLGHASFLVRLGDKTILTDPFLGSVAGPFGFGPRRYVPAAIPVEDLPPIDVIIVSHNHYDHLDAGTVDAIANKDQIEVIVPLRLGDFFRDRGYRNVRELDWHDQHQIGNITVTALPAVHFSSRSLFDRNRTLWASFMLQGDDRKIWFSGDTGYGTVFKKIGERYGPFDLGMIAIGAYDPPAIMRPVHVNPEEAVTLLRDIGAKRAIGMHWGTIRLTEEPPFEPSERFKQAADDQGFGADNAWILQIGESRTIPHLVGGGS